MEDFKEIFAKQMQDIVSFEWQGQQKPGDAPRAAAITSLSAVAGKAFKIKTTEAAATPAPAKSAPAASIVKMQQRTTGAEVTKVQPRHRR